MTHDAAAEEAVIGAVLRDARVLASVPGVVLDDFAVGSHVAIWAAIRNLESEGRPIDLVTCGDELEQLGRQRGVDLRGQCEATLGLAYLRCPTIDRVVEYAEILRKHRLTRACLRVLASLQAAGTAGSLEGEELISEAAGEILRLSEGTSSGDPGQTVARIAQAEIRQVAREMDSEVVATASGMPTGLARLDALTGGIPFGVTTMILARPGVGKTTLAQNIAWCAAVIGGDTPILYSYEDGHTSFAQRSIAQSSGVATERIRSRRLEGIDLARMYGARRHQLAGRREVVVLAAGMTVEGLIRDLRARRMRGSADGSTVGRLVIVDYIQNMPLPPGGNRNERIGEVSRKLAECASKDGIAMVVCSQMSRGVEGRDNHVPKISDARDSGDLEQHAKLVIGLYRPSIYGAPPTGDGGSVVAPPTLLELHVLKNHNGQTNCYAEVFWDLETHTIVDSGHDIAARRLLGQGLTPLAQ